MSKPTAEVKNRYNKKAYDDLRIVVPKGRKADLEEYCKGNDTTINGLVNDLLRDKIGMTTEQWKKRVEEQP